MADGLRDAVPDVEALTAVRFPCTAGPGAVLHAVVEALFAHSQASDHATVDATAGALPHLLAATAASNRGTGTLVSSLRAHHKRRLLDFVRHNLHNPQLDARLVAASVGLSTRYVYAVFADEGIPLMKWVWRSRLERCHADLVDPALRTHSIAEISLAWGFSDVAHFSRAFRQRYGCSPSEHRAARGSRPT